MRRKSWNDIDLKKAVKNSRSLREVIIRLNLVPAGGNYEQVQTQITFLKLSIVHFQGKGWRKGSKIPIVPALPLKEIMVAGSHYQSFKLKKRLFAEGIKEQKCEECGWAKRSADGRLPLELDHINGDRHDNRVENLRVLCPNCHSLQPTHRGRNKKGRNVRVA